MNAAATVHTPETFAVATPADIPALVALLAILFAQEAEFTPDREKQARGLRLIIASPEMGRVFVARVDGQVVGMVNLLATVSTAEGARACWLEDVIVHPDYRGNGLGSRLLRHVVTAARAEGFARVSLLADRANTGAIRFYARHGFHASEMMTMRLHL